MITSERLDKFLQEKGWSRRRLAREAKIPPSTLQSAMERGEITDTRLLEKISIALNIPAGELLGLEYMGGNFWGKEADDETVIKIAQNMERWRKINHLDTQGLVDGELIEPLGRIKAAFDKLNEDGQNIAAERVEELTKIPDYQKKTD